MPTDVYLFCKPESPNWAVILELPDLLQKRGWKIKKVSMTLRRGPVIVQYDSFGEGLEDIRKNGEPRGYDILVQ